MQLGARAAHAVGCFLAAVALQVWHAAPSGPQATSWQSPAWQVRFWPQAVPSAFGFLMQWPSEDRHTPVLQSSSWLLQLTPAPGVQTPFWQLSPAVQLSLSALHPVPLAFGCLMQTPSDVRQTPSLQASARVAQSWAQMLQQAVPPEQPLLLTLPSGIVVRQNVALARFVLLAMIAPVRLASIRHEPLRLALVRLAPLQVGPAQVGAADVAAGAVEGEWKGCSPPGRTG